MIQTKKETNNRICIITKKSMPKNELIRFAFSNGELVIDLDNKIKSRGFYISKNEINNLDKKILMKEASKSLKRKANIDMAFEEITK